MSGAAEKQPKKLGAPCSGVDDPNDMTINKPLPVLAKAVLLPLNILATWLCSNMFTWLCHDLNATYLPAFQRRVNFASSLWARELINIALVAFFGLVHSGFAREPVRWFLHHKLGVPRQVIRTVFMSATAAAWCNVMFLWQHNPEVLLWDLRPYTHYFLTSVLQLSVDRAAVDLAFHTYAPLVSLGFTVLCLMSVLRHDYWQFTGVRQLLWRESDGALAAEQQKKHADATPVLITTGIYRLVRHPMYMWLLMIMVVAPVMKLDRFVFFSACATFLAIALPLEEEKLVAEFGQAYRDYQQCVPSFIPFLPMPKKLDSLTAPKAAVKADKSS